MFQIIFVWKPNVKYDICFCEVNGVDQSEADCKPGSVVKDHLSGRLIAQPLEQLTRG